MNPIGIAFVFALAVSAVLTPFFRGLARRLGWIDNPNERSSHSVPTPRTGGKAILLGGAAGVVATAAYDRGLVVVFACAALLAILGMLDDARNLGWLPKLAAQLVAAGGVLAMPEMRPLGLGVLIAAIFIVGYTNAFNFMDGVNGIAALQAMISGATMGLLLWRAGDTAGALVCFAIAGGAAGFFPWNAFTGSIFMGDVGSLPLGFLFAAFVLRGAKTGIPAWVMALPLLPFLLDTGLTLLRRIARREQIVRAHRSHFYQQLTDLGWSHLAVTLLWGGFAALGAAVALWKPAPFAIALAVVVQVLSFAVIGLRHRSHCQAAQT